MQGGYAVEVVADLEDVQALLARRAYKRPLVVGIEGASCSGKTCLARRLAKLSGVSAIETDRHLQA